MGDRYILTKNTLDKTKIPYFIYVDTRNRLSGTRTNFTYKIRNLERFQKVYGVITNYEFSHIYQIDSSNNTFVFQDASLNTRVVNLDPGSYTTASICAELKAKLDVASPPTVWSFTYDDDSDLITVGITGALYVDLLFGDPRFTAKSWLRESKTTTQTVNNLSFYTFSERFTSLPQSYLLLQCSNLMLNPSVFTDQIAGSQIFERIMVPPRYSIAYYSENHLSYVCHEIDVSSGILNFQLLRPDGTAYNETNIKDYSFQIAIYPVS